MSAAQITSTTFDQNDAKYLTCCASIHLKTAARIISVICIVAAVFNVVFATALGATVALYSWASLAFASAIFGCLVYGVFKEKRVYMLPYLLFQGASIVMSAIAIFVFIVGMTVSEKMLLKLAEDIGGIDVNIETNPDLINELQIFTVFFVLSQCVILLVQIWFFEIIYRFREFIKDRETSFSFNLEGIFQTTPNAIYGTSVDDLEIVNGPPDYDTLK